MLGLRESIGFTPGAADVAPEEVERRGTDCGKEKRAIGDRMLLAPELNERFLHDILGVRDGANKLARKEDEAGRGFCETDFPIFVCGDILHDLFRVFDVTTPPALIFV